MKWYKTSENIPASRHFQTKVLMCTNGIVTAGLFTPVTDGDEWAEYDPFTDRYRDCQPPTWWAKIVLPKEAEND